MENPDGMVWIPPGTFEMGSNDGNIDETPRHKVQLTGFWMDRTEVTNAEFARFVRDTGYVTVAEQIPNAKDFPGADPALLKPGALVFTEGVGWSYTIGANWRHPLGPQSSINGKDDYPVVQVCWQDAEAFAKWAGKSLPTEAQYEFAARGGDDRAAYAWGDSLLPDNRYPANVWQGDFPNHNLNLDGFAQTAPVASFKPNGYGLYDIAGNVWEWCQDWYEPHAYETARLENPNGPLTSHDPDEPGLSKRVVRGGSYLCAENSCQGYRLTARMKSTPDTGLCHTGFRCVKNVPESQKGRVVKS